MFSVVMEERLGLRDRVFKYMLGGYCNKVLMDYALFHISSNSFFLGRDF